MPKSSKKALPEVDRDALISCRVEIPQSEWPKEKGAPWPGTVVDLHSDPRYVYVHCDGWPDLYYFPAQRVQKWLVSSPKQSGFEAEREENNALLHDTTGKRGASMQAGKLRPTKKQRRGSAKGTVAGASDGQPKPDRSNKSKGKTLGQAPPASDATHSNQHSSQTSREEPCMSAKAAAALAEIPLTVKALNPAESSECTVARPPTPAEAEQAERDAGKPESAPPAGSKLVENAGTNAGELGSPAGLLAPVENEIVSGEIPAVHSPTAASADQKLSAEVAEGLEVPDQAAVGTEGAAADPSTAGAGEQGAAVQAALDKSQTPRSEQQCTSETQAGPSQPPAVEALNGVTAMGDVAEAAAAAEVPQLSSKAADGKPWRPGSLSGHKASFRDAGKPQAKLAPSPGKDLHSPGDSLFGPSAAEPAAQLLGSPPGAQVNGCGGHPSPRLASGVLAASLVAELQQRDLRPTQGDDGEAPPPPPRQKGRTPAKARRRRRLTPEIAMTAGIAATALHAARALIGGANTPAGRAEAAQGRGQSGGLLQGRAEGPAVGNGAAAGGVLAVACIANDAAELALLRAENARLSRALHQEQNHRMALEQILVQATQDFSLLRQGRDIEMRAAQDRALGAHVPV